MSDGYGVDWILTGRPARQLEVGDKIFRNTREHRAEKIENRRGYVVTFDTGLVIDADLVEGQEFTIFRPRKALRV